MIDDADISYGPNLVSNPETRCDCGARVRMKAHQPAKVGIAIMVPVNLDGTLHYCHAPVGCARARVD